MSETATNIRWSNAFARQADADLSAREFLARNNANLPACHELHFLQMACEKICKAHLMARPGADAMKLQHSHAYISTTLPLIAREWLARQNQHRAKETHVISRIRKLSEKIERLAPASSAGGTVPSNCEYPWMDRSGRIVVPAEHNFEMTLLYEPAGRTLIKILPTIAKELSS